MYLTIVLRKEVADEVEAQGIFEFVVDKLLGHPDVKVTGQVNSTLALDSPAE